MTPGVYNVHEDGASEVDEEIRRLSFVGDRTQKLSSCAVLFRWFLEKNSTREMNK